MATHCRRWLRSPRNNVLALFVWFLVRTLRLLVFLPLFAFRACSRRQKSISQVSFVVRRNLQWLITCCLCLGFLLVLARVQVLDQRVCCCFSWWPLHRVVLLVLPARHAEHQRWSASISFLVLCNCLLSCRFWFASSLSLLPVATLTCVVQAAAGPTKRAPSTATTRSVLASMLSCSLFLPRNLFCLCLILHLLPFRCESVNHNLLLMCRRATPTTSRSASASRSASSATSARTSSDRVRFFVVFLFHSFIVLFFVCCSAMPLAPNTKWTESYWGSLNIRFVLFFVM